MTQTNGLVDAKALAQHFGVKVATVHTWVRQGRIPCIRVSQGTVRFRLPDVEQALTRNVAAASAGGERP